MTDKFFVQHAVAEGVSHFYAHDTIESGGIFMVVNNAYRAIEFNGLMASGVVSSKIGISLHQDYLDTFIHECSEVLRFIESGKGQDKFLINDKHTSTRHRGNGESFDSGGIACIYVKELSSVQFYALNVDGIIIDNYSIGINVESLGELIITLNAINSKHCVFTGWVSDQSKDSERWRNLRHNGLLTVQLDSASNKFVGMLFDPSSNELALNVDFYAEADTLADAKAQTDTLYIERVMTGQLGN